MPKRIDTSTQLKALAMFARGDTYKKISEALTIPMSTLQAIKDRNSVALSTIQNKLVEHEVSQAKKLLAKSQKLIEKQLDQAEDGEKDISITELNAVQKEAFHQSQVESGLPTSISSQGDAKEQLMQLAEAIKQGDEVELYKMVVKPHD